jgi:hypothetical protein
MKKWILMAMVVTIISLLGCSRSSTPSESISTPKKITLEDASDILDLSLLLPSRFENIDAVDEGMSNADMGLGKEFSEVQLFLSEDPYQMIYCFLYISKSRLERVQFDRVIEDEAQMKTLIEESISAGANEVGNEVTVPSIEFSRPNVGDSVLFGQGRLESYGFFYGFDTLWFRSNTVYVMIYSVSNSGDRVSLVTVAKEIEKRLGKYSQ